jgi:glycosyltransferase involved in cell wall biosynthesis
MEGTRIGTLAAITSGYPSAREPSKGAFVASFARAVASTGVRCAVVAPVAVHRAWRGGAEPPPASDGGDGSPEVVRPRFLSLSTRTFAGLTMAGFTQWAFERAVEGAIRRMEAPPDALYGHFMYPAGAAAVRVGARLGIPGFVGVGEGRFWSIRPLGVARARRDLGRASGIVAVSTPIKRKLVEEVGLPEEAVRVFPNGPDTRLFYPRDRREARRKRGFHDSAFLVGFVGHLIADKGPLRLAEAIEGLEGVKGVYMGRGPQRPTGDRVQFVGELPHGELPEMLSACDIFVLPTTHEGSCNALAEAMACGLPVVTSVGDFNDDMVNEQVSIRVDPMDVAQIRDAIRTLKEDAGRRERMAEAALARAAKLDARVRAEAILGWMEGRCQSRG